MNFSTKHPKQKRYVTLALEITKQKWSVLGFEDGNVNSLELAAESIMSLLLIRLVGLAEASHKFHNLSTTCICETILRSQERFWPEKISAAVIQQLRNYVKTILRGYNSVPYHNFEHAYQVVLSSNKLLDEVLQSKAEEPSQSSVATLRFNSDPQMHLALLFAALVHDVEHQVREKWK